jgi:hypothetical protein
LEIGDSVVPAVARKAIVVLPLVDAGGNETNVGRQVAEELTTTLVNRGVAVVERSILEKVLSELAIQQSSLIDPKTAQRVGKQIGAYAVLTGTVLPKEQTRSAELQHTAHVTGQWRPGQIDLDKREALRVVGPKPAGAEVQARLIKVETGEILAAASQNVTGVTVRVVHPNIVRAPRHEIPVVSSEKSHPSWKLTSGGYPLIAGVWHHTHGPRYDEVRISQQEEAVTAECAYHHPKFGEIRWVINGTISKDGRISGTFRNTVYPPDQPSWLVEQKRIAVLNYDGRAIQGFFSWDFGGKHHDHYFAWGIGPAGNDDLERTPGGYPLIAGVWWEGPPSNRHIVTISQNDGEFTAHGVCRIASWLNGQVLKPPLEWQMTGTISKDGDFSATGRDTCIPRNIPGWIGTQQTRTGALTIRPNEMSTWIHGTGSGHNDRGEQVPKYEFDWRLQRR